MPLLKTVLHLKCLGSIPSDSNCLSCSTGPVLSVNIHPDLKQNKRKTKKRMNASLEDQRRITTRHPECPYTLPPTSDLDTGPDSLVLLTVRHASSVPVETADKMPFLLSLPHPPVQIQTTLWGPATLAASQMSSEYFIKILTPCKYFQGDYYLFFLLFFCTGILRLVPSLAQPLFPLSHTFALTLSHSLHANPLLRAFGGFKASLSQLSL